MVKGQPHHRTWWTHAFVICLDKVARPHGGTTGLRRGRIAQTHGDIWRLHDVTSHIAHGSGPKVPETAPFERQVSVVEFTHGRRT